jgi:hypothetical protein
LSGRGGLVKQEVNMGLQKTAGAELQDGNVRWFPVHVIDSETLKCRLDLDNSLDQAGSG